MSSFHVTICKRKPNTPTLLSINCDSKLELDGTAGLYFQGHIAAFQDIVIEIQNPLVLSCQWFDLCRYAITTLSTPVLVNIIDVLDSGNISGQSLYNIPFDLQSVVCAPYKYSITLCSTTPIDLSGFIGCDVVIQLVEALELTRALPCLEQPKECYYIPGSLCILTLPAFTYEVALTKRIISTGPYRLGDSVTYEIIVYNTGNQDVNNIVVTDPLLGVTSNITTLAAGANQVVTVPSYTLTQTDIDNRELINTVSAASDEAETVTVDIRLPLPQPGLSVTKSGFVRAPGIGALGDIIDYKYVVTNTGDIPLTFVTTTDTVITSMNEIEATLLPGQAVSYLEAYTIIQADVNAGQVSNTVNVTAQTDGAPITASDTLTILLA